jgi:valyl-tRNA synthetase
MDIEERYDPAKLEPRWAKWWVENKMYHADSSAPEPRFSIVIPPPSVNGSLHIGHMLEHSIMDATVRWRRMRGYNTMWLPGTDHAGIATQLLVERMLASEGTSRKELGRAEFENRVWQWKEKYGARITDQMKQIGDSVDWSREKFTLSPELSRAVSEAFVRLYERGLIYRSASMVNWCPRCQTAISDLETVREETQGSLWHIRCPVAGTGRFLTVSTTRPETMLGVTAIAIHPQDERYFDLHGKTVKAPLTNREIGIVLDEWTDTAFGSGAVKVTPAHDAHDFEVGKRHNLPSIRVIDDQARMSGESGPYAGMDRFAARKQIIADLEAQGLMAEIAPHATSIDRCDRCKTIVEPLVSTQWFVRTKPLAEKALAAVHDGRIRFTPDEWTDSCVRSLESIGDWCISRQLWWGHRIPAWHCPNCLKDTVARVAPEVCSICGQGPLEQDRDVLDTWFSAGLWPFSTLGWPEETEDLKAYYPTSLLITGVEILFFWVARMIMLGLELTGRQPFRAIHIHGLVRDANRDKMSKTKGNVVDPLDITSRFGTDALRVSLTMGVVSGADVVFSEDNLTAARKFVDKVWNAARLLFIAMKRSAVEPPPVLERGRLETVEDRWIFSELQKTADTVDRAFENHLYHEAAEELCRFFGHDVCERYLEIKKLRLAENSGLTNDWRNVLAVFSAALRMLHPLMPFITEELWHRLGREDSISLQPYPAGFPVDEDAERYLGPRPLV